MTYELAKQLKEVGFPQEIINGKPANGSYLRKNPNAQSAVYAPTLGELIEACGDDFFSLEKENDGSWSAFDPQDFNDASGVGRTPTEAVARLWLALQKAA